MYRNLQIDVNIHYFPIHFSPSPWRKKKKAIQQGNPFKVILVQRMQIPINQKVVHLTYWVSWKRTSLNENNDNSLTSDGIELLKIVFPGKIGTDF
jgi:hypothetical protein